MVLVFYFIYVFLAVYNAGNMTSLQFQHYGIYPYVGKEQFAAYMTANNKAARIPAVIPGMLMLLCSIVLLFFRPGFMSLREALISFGLNLLGIFSTFRWQRPLQAGMAKDGYDEAKVRLLIRSNWIRTLAFIILGVFTLVILSNAMS